MQTHTSPTSSLPHMLAAGTVDPVAAFAFLLSCFRAEARAEAEAVWQKLEATRHDGGSHEEAKEVVSVREGAALLGVCVQTLYNLASKGIIKPYKLGGRTVYRRAELLASLKEQSRPDGTRRNSRRGKQQKTH